MNQWEQITFAIALAGFGWLLYSAHGQAGNDSTPANNAFESVSDVPWYLTFNQTAGFTGPLATPTVNQADFVGLPTNNIGMQNVSGCSTCNLLPSTLSM